MAFVSSTTLSNQVLESFDRTAMYALRSLPQFSAFAQVKPGDVTNPGNPVNFRFWTDMAQAVTPLVETTDITPVSLSDSAVQVTPVEYGNGIIKTVVIRSDSYLNHFDSDTASLVAWNMVDSIDKVAANALDASGTEYFANAAASEAALVAGDNLSSTEVRQMSALMAADNVLPFAGDFFSLIHPHIEFDLKDETGDGAWVIPASYVNTDKIYNNELGKFGGFRFITSSRALLTADGGAANVDSYTTYFIGKDCLAEAQTLAPSIVIGPVTDYLKRWQPIGWYAYTGYGELRAESTRRVLAASSIGANV